MTEERNPWAQMAFQTPFLFSGHKRGDLATHLLSIVFLLKEPSKIRENVEIPGHIPIGV